MICLSTHWIFCFLSFDHLFQFMYNLPDYCYVYNLPVTISINTCDMRQEPFASSKQNLQYRYYKIKSKGLDQRAVVNRVFHYSFIFYTLFKLKEFTETNTCLQSTVESVNGKCRNSNYNSGSVGRKTTLIMAQHREY